MEAYIKQHAAELDASSGWQWTMSNKTKVYKINKRLWEDDCFSCITYGNERNAKRKVTIYKKDELVKCNTAGTKIDILYSALYDANKQYL